jgi:hypothetical protein
MNVSETTEEMALITLQLEGKLGINKNVLVVEREFKVFICYSFAVQVTQVYVTTAASTRRIWQYKQEYHRYVKLTS